MLIIDEDSLPFKGVHTLPKFQKYRFRKSTFGILLKGLTQSKEVQINDLDL